MVSTVVLGGKPRYILFGQSVFKLYKDKTGRNLLSLISDMETGDLSNLPDVVYWALRVGELAQKVENPDTYTEMDVSIWLDESPEAFEICMGAFFDSIKAIRNIIEKQTKIAAQNGDTKKKTPGEAKTETIANTGT